MAEFTVIAVPAIYAFVTVIAVENVKAVKTVVAVYGQVRVEDFFAGNPGVHVAVLGIYTEGVVFTVFTIEYYVTN